MAKNSENTENVVAAADANDNTVSEPQFTIVEKSEKPDLMSKLPDPETFANDHVAGTEAKFTLPDGSTVTYVLTPPRGWTWQVKRGRNGKSTKSES